MTPIRVRGFDKRFRKGEDHPNWGGGVTINTNGYRLIKVLDHPNAQGGKWVPEHRLVMEKYLKRFLTKNEDVHHINGNRLDNRLKNLEILDRQSHMRIEYGWEKRSNRWFKPCRECKRQLPLENYRMRTHNGFEEYKTRCKNCEMP